ncbi:diacylglycerol kinase [Geodermatophilus sp. Leaf369]|nr:diacylglycerol kinase [Geodermatophilus sp. Leaf369]
MISRSGRRRPPTFDERPTVSFDKIVIVFNPKSTGDAPALAEDLSEELARRLPGTPLEMAPTQHAGHARDLARKAAAHGRPLVVSVSGDGGYNEVVDGVMQADNPEATAAVRAAGNANDHRRVTRTRPLADAIVAGDTTQMDLLRLTLAGGGHDEVRYAHSYIGLGITPVVAVDIEAGGKGSWREIASVVRGFRSFRPFPVRLEDGQQIEIDSLLYANIAQMAKVAKLSEGGRPDDGRFELVVNRRTSKLKVLATAVKAATVGLGAQPTATHHELTVLTPMPLQLDGELVELEADTTVTVDIAPGALRTLF